MPRSLFVVVSMVLAAYAFLPHIVGNIALVAMTKDSGCTPYVAECRAGMQDMSLPWRANGETALALVQATKRIALNPDVLRWREAESLMAVGDYEAAARIVPPLPLPTYRQDREPQSATLPTRLLGVGQPEQAILAAYQQASAGNTTDAIAAMRVAIATAPTALTDKEWQAYYEWMGVDPTPAAFDPVGRTTPAYSLSTPVTLDTGYDLIGVDVDTATMASGGKLTLWLWLTSETLPPPSDAIDINATTWVVRYNSLNLAPNPGFEWGMQNERDRPTPAGYFYLWTASTLDGVGVEPQNNNHAWTIRNETILNLRTYPLAVDPDAIYLMGATAQTTGRVSLGLFCIPPDLRADYRDSLWAAPLQTSDAQIAFNGTGNSQNMLYATVADPFETPALCQFMVETQSNLATVDNVFLVQVNLQ